MMAALKWLPAFPAALLWVLLNSLAQPLSSRFGILLYTDAALLLVPARFFPLRLAIPVVLFGTFCADALRTGPFGFSATVLLPVLLALYGFQEKLRTLSSLEWLAVISAVNILTWGAFAWTYTFYVAAPMPVLDILQGVFAGMLVSSAFIILFGFWFESFQISLFALFGKDLYTDPRKEALES